MLKKLFVFGTIFTSLSIGNSTIAAEIESETTVTNISSLSEVSSLTSGIAGETFGKKIKCSSKVKASNPIFGSPSATATSSAAVKEDTIAAKVRVYSSKGGLKGQKTDSQKNSTYAGATFTDKSNNIPATAFGNHTYVKKSYKTVVHETKDKF
ncbi:MULTISPECIES: hypothetical protein [Bacillaceae]|uniref:hypothetical protein n=1 Tax=Bacillaceae TaxID=186817 RepID=UPI000C278AA3|nr:hypothetical protein [Bacillus sp. mrc49]PJN86553.1 hypothetical protein CVN76_30150 [Bacillus sp. mrc49]